VSFGLAADMAAAGQAGSIVTLLCDGGERYAHTYYDDEWVAAKGWSLDRPIAQVTTFLTTGTWAGGD
jgi:cysteine synthase A